MPGPGPADNQDFDAQDRAETFDETHLDEARAERRTFDEMDDVEDVTQAAGDADDDLGDARDAADFDEDAIGDADLEADARARPVLADDDLNAEGDAVLDDGDRADLVDRFDADDPGRDVVEGLRRVRSADSVEGGEDDVTDFQSRNVSDEDLKTMGYSNDPAAKPPTTGERDRDVEKGTGADPTDVADTRDLHTEKNLDEAVEETFPASDPISPSPGAN